MTEHDSIIAFNLIAGIGFARFRQLRQFFGSASAALTASEQELASVKGIGPALAAAVATFPMEQLDEELRFVERSGVRIFTLDDPGYPQILNNIYDPPLCLYVRGELPAFGSSSVAIVGSRRMSAYGGKMARLFAEGAASAGFSVVSGLAFGVDAVAHQATLDANGITVAVLGGGLAKIHPQEHIPLAKAIVEHGGAVISEFPMRFPVSRTSFPRRNRIVAGLCANTIVIEAGLDSGAMITARLALEQNRNVFAVPGHADNPQAKGCHKLIKDGAFLAEDFSDVLSGGEYLFGAVSPMIRSASPALGSDPYADLTEDKRTLIGILQEKGEMELDGLVLETGWDAGKLFGALTELEIALIVERANGRRYSLRRKG
ncbi:MAG: DNA-processing protein DprA [Victivallaceae bacterium]|nr:DNA-processing protein DprA [Victivallaceae bacterium]